MEKTPPGAAPPPGEVRYLPDGDWLLAYVGTPFELVGRFLRFDCRNPRRLVEDVIPLAKDALAGGGGDTGFDNFSLEIEGVGVTLTDDYGEGDSSSVVIDLRLFLSICEEYVKEVTRYRADRGLT